MEILQATEMGTFADDDFLNFTLEEEAYKTSLNLKDDASASSSSTESSNPKRKMLGSQTQNSFPEAALEEDLEWLSNKDAFPSVETCFGLLQQLSPVSVLDSNSNNNGNCNTGASCFGTLKVPINHPVGIRSKKTRRIPRVGEFPSKQCVWSNQVNLEIKQESLISLPPSILAMKNSSGAYMRRRCLHCQAEKTPQWRAGPMGPKTLCNACGVRYKSGRLLPEYRPASSPTFSSELHSNSHRKVVEMRMQRQRRGIVKWMGLWLGSRINGEKFITTGLS